MITESRTIYESLEELISDKYGAMVGDIVLVSENSETEKAPYVAAHKEKGTGNLILVRKNIMADYRPMQDGDFDLLKWLDNDFKKGILEYLPEKFHSNVGLVSIPSIREVFGKDKFGTHSDGEQFDWFKDPINRIAILEGEEHSDWYWLRDVVSATGFADVGNYGDASYSGASGADIGVRPAFGIS